MKKPVLLLLTCLLCARLMAFEHLISYKLYQTVTKDDFEAMMAKRHLPRAMVNCHYTVDVYDITYESHWHDGSTIKASGLYYVPRNAGIKMPEVVYHHGTRVNKGRSEKLGPEEYLCVGMAVDGYLILEPDYIGLGTGDKFHLYQLASSEGQGSVDMLFAVQELNKALNISDNNMLFLTGYSEGGYACLATHKLIQDKYSDKLHVTASSPMSGAYDMAGAQSEVMFRHYSRPHYLPYLLRAYNEVYNLVGPDVNVVYKQPYDTLIPKLFDGTHNINQIDKQLPSIPGDMIVDSFVKRYKAEVNFPLKLALKENSLCDWKPDAPVQLCYCDSDEQVTCKNSFAAYNGMKSKGAAHVTLRRAAKNLGHSKCAIVAMLDTKMYFDTFRKGSKYGNKGAAGKRILASIVRAAVVKQSKKQATEHRNRAQAEHKPGREGEKKG